MLVYYFTDLKNLQYSTLHWRHDHFTGKHLIYAEIMVLTSLFKVSTGISQHERKEYIV